MHGACLIHPTGRRTRQEPIQLGTGARPTNVGLRRCLPVGHSWRQRLPMGIMMRFAIAWPWAATAGRAAAGSAVQLGLYSLRDAAHFAHACVRALCLCSAAIA
jgi:hypothetical protein